MLAKMEKYTSQADFDVEYVKSKLRTPPLKLCSWVRALESYAKSLRDRQNLRGRTTRLAEEKLAKHQRRYSRSFQKTTTTD